MIDLFELNVLNSKPEEAYRESDIAIVGVSIHLPMTDSLDDLYGVLKRKLDCIREIPENRKNDVVSYLNMKGIENIKFDKAGYLENIDLFDSDFFKITPYEAKLMNPNQRLALMSIYEAIEDAGYSDGKLNNSNTGVFIGHVEIDSYKYKEMIMEHCSKDDIDVGAIGNLNSMIPSRISYFLNLKGPCYLVDSACSSSMLALHQACKAIEVGDCEQAIVSSNQINILPYNDGIRIGMESEDECVKAFDNGATGTVKGEGSISFFIKPMKNAKRDMDYIYAIIKGSAVNHDGTTMGITAPSAEAQSRVFQAAWNNSRINPEDLGCIEAHGTGTRIGDVIEIEALSKAFDKYTKKKQFCAISSLKSNYGHLYDASGLAAISKCLTEFKYRKLLPGTNFSIPNNKIAFENSPIYVCDSESDWQTDGKKRLCGVSSFGFSGTNCHVVLEEGPEIQDYTMDEEYNILALSAKNEEMLLRLLNGYDNYLAVNKNSHMTYLCYTANNFRAQKEKRVVFAFRDKKELKKLVIDILEVGNVDSRLYSTYSVDSGKELLIKDYLSGKKTDWSVLYDDSQRVMIPIPLSPWDSKRYWVLPKLQYENVNAGVVKEPEMSADVITVKNQLPAYAEYDKVLEGLQEAVCDLLDMPDLVVTDSLMDIGVDSILLVKVQKKIDELYPGIISTSKMFIYSSIAKMAEYICEEINNRNKGKVNEEQSKIRNAINEFLFRDEDDHDVEDLTVEQLLDKIIRL